VPTREHFVIIGAQRTGTTYLYGLLNEHPEIEMAKPLRPEPKFFLDDDLYARGLDYYEERFFDEPSARVRGEKSTSYIESEVVAERIMHLLPGAVIVVVVRDPVERALSNYAFTVSAGNEDLPLDDALRASASGERAWDRQRFSVSPYAYLPRGRYIDYLERYGRHVPSEQLYVVVFEELVAGADAIAALYARLGVDPGFRPRRLGDRVNAAERESRPIEKELGTWLRDYYREPNQRLTMLLGRELPWTT
jgi:hypothetical protein